jgi:hypothetical protein
MKSFGCRESDARKTRTPARAALVERQIGVPCLSRLAAVEHDGLVHRRGATVVQIGCRLGETPQRPGEEDARRDLPLWRTRREPVPHVVALEIAEQVHEIRRVVARVLGLDLRTVAVLRDVDDERGQVGGRTPRVELRISEL